MRSRSQVLVDSESPGKGRAQVRHGIITLPESICQVHRAKVTKLK